jgi:hypothetical protein
MFVVPATPVLLPLWGVWMVASWLRLRCRAMVAPLRLVMAWVMGSCVVSVLAVTLFPLQVALGDYANHASMLSKVNLIPRWLSRVPVVARTANRFRVPPVRPAAVRKPLTATDRTA